MTAKRPLSFVDGIGIGVGSLMLLPLLAWVVLRPGYIEMYKQMGPSAKLPSLTITMFGSLWTYGVPLALLAAGAFAIWRRPNRWLIFVIGGLALVLSIVTWYGAYAPILALAGNIR